MHLCKFDQMSQTGYTESQRGRHLSLILEQDKSSDIVQQPLFGDRK